MTEQDYMKRAIALAGKGEGWCHPNPKVGAVVVKNGRIIGEGYHARYGELHAERNALASLLEPAEGATLYVTLEPCCHYGKTPPCTEAIIAHKIAKVVIGSPDPNPKVAGGGKAQLRAAGIDVVEDFMREECDALNPVFFHYITTGYPYVLMKYAMTADGKIATRIGASKWITGEASRRRVQEMRHACMGIMVGIGTVLSDDPMLDCRLENGRNPVRIICDSRLQIPENSRIVQSAALIPVIVASSIPELPEGEITKDGCDTEQLLKKEQKDSLHMLLLAGVRIVNFPSASGVDLKKLLLFLGNAGIDSILLEGGGILNESMLEEGLVQELAVFIAPKIFGGSARSPVEGYGVALPEEAFMLDLSGTEQIDQDLLLHFRMRHPYENKADPHRTYV